jgi:DNA-directed RNA polymerase beta' subunit
MKLKLLDVNRFCRGLTPITTTELRTKSGEYAQDGLFSEKIFGIEGSLDRSKRYSFIQLNAMVVHPAAYKLLIRIDRKIEKLLNTEQSFSLNNQKQLVEDENGISGITKFIEMFPEIKLKAGTPAREKIIKVLQDSYKQDILFIDKLPVIPPDIRPMYEDESGNLVIDEMNNIYINVLRKASQIKSVGKESTLFDLLNFYLQTAINDHDKFVRTKISKKSGLIRSNMLGKRVDFSARAVITPGPQLKVNEIGIPLRLAVSLFQPFLVHYLLFSRSYPRRDELEQEVKSFTESDLSVDTVDRVIKSIKIADDIPKSLYDLFFEACEIVIKDRVVLAKRDPALHDGSYRAFYPVLIHGHTIQICTLQVGGFNADFDGDQMALFHPLTKQAQEEAKTKMMGGKGSKHSGHVTYEISKEMAAGLYTMTKNKQKTNSPLAVDKEILEKATDPYIRVKFRNKVTTMGRAIFNSFFPNDWPFMEVLITKRYVNNLIPKIIDKYGDDKAREIFSNIEKVGFKFATIMSPTITLDMLELPDSILRIKEKLPDASPEEADKLLKDAERIMINHLKDTGLYDLIESGSGKGWSQPRQILVAKGVIADPKGNLLPPIKGSFSEGLQTTEYFSAASGARKGMADRSLNTSTTGYFTRQLVYVLSPAEASPTVRDCKTRRTIILRLTNDLIKRLSGRYIIRGNNLIEFNPAQYKAGDSIRLRSPIYCESRKFCHTCYGNLLKRHKTPYVGILAGSAIGERGTQLIMRTFHTGGAASITQHNSIQEIVDNDPLISTDLKKYLYQDEDKLITLKPAVIMIDLTNYTMNDNIQINTDHVWVNHLISKIEYEDTMFNIMLDYPVRIKKINMKITGKETMQFTFTGNDIMFEIPLQTEEIKEQVNYVNRLLGGKVVYKDPSHMITKIMKIYGGRISDLDLVHFEVLISQVLRDKLNQALPARLGKTWDPVMMNIKNTIFSSGFIQGLAFENINKAIETGLISEGELEPSILGRLVTGEVIK